MSAHEASREMRAAPSPRDERELGLFVIWEKGRQHERRILADLETRFTILEVHETRWASSATNNFARFYADIAVRGVYHVLSKGAGPFLAVTLVDASPRLEHRQTARGRRLVNARFFDAKQSYRKLRGAELGVHCSETRQELVRDLMLLLGVSADRYLVETTVPWHGYVEQQCRDLVGAQGWSTWEELFLVLNHTIDYAVLEYPPAWRAPNGPRLVLLTDDGRALCRIANARSTRRAELSGGAVTLEVAGKRARPTVRFPGDGCYDPRWYRHVLASRTLDERGFYTPPAADRFWMVAYDALARGGDYSADRARDLALHARSLGSCEACTDARAARVLLDRFVRARGYTHTRPLDPAAQLDTGTAHRGRRGTLLRAWRRRARAAALPMLDAAMEGYSSARDALLLHAPWVRSLKKRWLAKLGSSPVRALRSSVLFVRGLAFAGRRFVCPCCGWQVRAFVGRWGWGWGAQAASYCPRCNAKARHRRLWLYLDSEFLADGAWHTGTRGALWLLDVAPWPALARRVRSCRRLNYVGIDLAARGPHVSVRGNVTALPFADARFDIVVCQHVLEHVQDDARALAELFRVTVPGGHVLVSVPIRLDRPTHEDPSVVTPQDRERAFGERSHVRYYGHDLAERLAAAGFRVALDRADSIPEHVRERHGLRTDEHVFHCRRPEVRELETAQPARAGRARRSRERAAESTQTLH